MVRSILSTFLLGARLRQALPERVREAVLAEQDQAEIIIGSIQVLLTLFFITLYAVAPKAAGMAQDSVAPAPFVLAGYLLFGLYRVAYAHYRRVPPWLLTLSILVDVGLLMGLIWGFHVQYGQPPPFYLKAPTLLYVFIFISLRALRFEPTYVVTAGLTAAAAWVGMVWYAVAASAPAAVVTRDYVAYLTSNLVLLGGEIDKVITILLVTLILAVALTRARRLLVRAVTDEEVARDLSRFVAPEVAARAAKADRSIEPGCGEVVTASVMFCDIESFSTMSESVPPPVLMATLNEYFAAMAEAADRHGGVISMFQGDATLIAFNTAAPNPEHAACAVRCALAIQDTMATRRFGPGIALKTRCGINTGEIVIGAVGAADRLYYTVFGDEVNVAARLEQLNKACGSYILISDRCRAAAGPVGAFHPIGAIQVRGRSAPVEVFAVTSEGDAPPLVGLSGIVAVTP